MNMWDRQQGMAVCAINLGLGALRGLETPSSISRIPAYGGHPRSDSRLESGMGAAVVLEGGRG